MNVTERMTHPELHPALKTPLVSEAVFEIRFATKVPYGVLPGRLYEALQELFPVVEQLPAAQIPLEIDAPIPRHRFKSKDASRMVQVGVGLVSLNHTGYAGYETFRGEAERLLRAADRLQLLRDVKRLGLRYINRAPLDRPTEEIVTYSIDAPPLIDDTVEARRMTLLGRVQNVGVLQTSVAWPVSDTSQSKDAQERWLVLDFDCYADRKGSIRIADAMTWLDKGHEHVYQAFRASLQPQFLSSLEG